MRAYQSGRVDNRSGAALLCVTVMGKKYKWEKLV